MSKTRHIYHVRNERTDQEETFRTKKRLERDSLIQVNRVDRNGTVHFTYNSHRDLVALLLGGEKRHGKGARSARTDMKPGDRLRIIEAVFTNTPLHQMRL